MENELVPVFVSDDNGVEYLSNGEMRRGKKGERIMLRRAEAKELFRAGRVTPEALTSGNVPNVERR